MNGSSAARTAWAVCTGSLALLGASLLLIALAWPSPPPDGFVAWPGQAITIVGAMGAPVLGLVILTRRPEHRYGWLWSGYGVLMSAYLAARTYVTYATARPESLPGRDVVAVAADLSWMAWLTLTPFLLLWFPTGRVPSPGWRWASRAAVLGGVLMLGAGAVSPRLGVVPLANPIGLPGDLGAGLTVVADVGVYLVFATVVAASVSMVVRYREATEHERRQIAWFAGAAGGLGLFFLTDPFLELPGVWDALLEVAALAVLYLAVGIAIVRHGLYDVDRVLNRTLVYVTLTALLLGTYVLVVGYLGSVLPGRSDTVVSLAATGLVAVLFAPLRDRLQQGVNRFMYGQRTDPYTVVSELGRRLETVSAPDDVAATIVEAIARTLDLPRVELWLAEGEALRLAAVHGRSPDATTVSGPDEVVGARGISSALPLTHRGQAVGTLAVAPRHATRGLTRGEQQLLRELTVHIGPAAHAVGLTAELRTRLADLRRSREQLVASQQEERLRIHRDLHDGLGPVLASMRLRLEACLDQVPPTAPALGADLERLHDLVGRATADIRTLVHDLHPPELARAGLTGALREHCDRFSRETGIDVRLEAPADLDLPAAVQVATLRIVQESLVNVDKHAEAERVEVRLEQSDGVLVARVSDDGRGVGDLTRSAGSGVGSMQARATHLGGTLCVAPTSSGGTVVTARLPTQGRLEGAVGR